MNKWQMSGATLGSFNRGSAMDNYHTLHRSIHPFGRSDAYRAEQRRRRFRTSGEK